MLFIFKLSPVGDLKNVFSLIQEGLSRFSPIVYSYLLQETICFPESRKSRFSLKIPGPASPEGKEVEKERTSALQATGLN